MPQLSDDRDNLPPLPPTPLGRYRHYKGGEYEVFAVARHSETLEPLVFYRTTYDDSGWWVRPHAMFFGQVEVDGKLHPRFEWIAPLSPSVKWPGPGSPGPGPRSGG